MDFEWKMRRYKIDSMKYDQRMNGGVSVFDMNDWNQPYTTSPPSSRGGEDDTSSVTHSRQRRSRLDNDIPHPRGPIMIQQSAARQSSRKSQKQVNGTSMSNGNQRGHNSTFNGYDLQYKRYHQNSSRGPNESFSGIYPSSRNMSGYASDYLNSRGAIGLLPNNMREPRRPRSTAAEKYTNTAVSVNGFGYESGESEKTSEELEEEEEEEELAKYYMEARRVQGSRSVTNNMSSDNCGGEDEKYYYGVLKLSSQNVAHVFRTMPPPEEYFQLKPIERVAYVFYCAVYNKPYKNVPEFHKIFNREFYNYVCSGDTDDLALYKICKSMQDQYTLKQLEASRLAYEKAQKEAAESEKLDFNQHRIIDPDEHKVAILQPEEVLSNGPLHYHACLQFATIGVGGKLVIVRPAGTVDTASGHILSTTSVHVDDLRTLLHFDEQSEKVIESVQHFKGPLIAGQTPTHSVRLYIQRQIDSLRQICSAGDVKKSEVVDALLIWQLLEIMVQQHGRVTGPDIATLLTNASEELAEKTGISEVNVAEAVHKSNPKERFNKFLLGGHINEAVESAISDGLYADAMTLIRRLHPNDTKKIEEIETRFMHLRSIDDPFATLVAVASDQPPPILTNSAFDDDNNWKRHAAIVLANLSSQAAMQTIYHLGLLLARRERNCAADFCLLVVCLLAGYDPFFPIAHTDGEERSRKHIGLVHSGSSLLNRVDGLSGSAGFSFTDLHATDIFDYALRLGNNSADSPLAKSVEYQLIRIEYAKKLASYGGFATDAFRYCTEVARSLWPYIVCFDRHVLLDLCDLAESLQYVAAATPAEVEWIASMKAMLDGVSNPVHDTQEVSQLQPQPTEDHSISSEAQKWHDEHQAPIEIGKRVPPHYQEIPPPAKDKCNQQVQESPQKYPETSSVVTRSSQSTPTVISSELSEPSSTEKSGSSTTAKTSTSMASSIAESAPPTQNQKKVEKPCLAAPPPPPMPMMQQYVPEIRPPVDVPPPVSLPSLPASPPLQRTPPVDTTIVRQSKPIAIPSNFDADLAKSPRAELEDLWGAPPPSTKSAAAYPPARIASEPPPPITSTQPPPPPASLPPNIKQSAQSQPSVPNSKTTAPPAPAPMKPVELARIDRKGSKGWLESIKDKVLKSIPSANQMILPDDSKPSIVWDPVKQKYVGAGVEKEVAAPPPPVVPVSHLTGEGADSNKSSTNSLRSARSGVGSRYLQSGMSTSQPPAMGAGIPSMMPPTMPLPMSFQFMPVATDDNSTDHVDPFSGQATVPSESES